METHAVATPADRFGLKRRTCFQEGAVKEVSGRVLADRGRYEEVIPERQTSKDPSPLKVKEVLIEDRRYIVCLYEEQRHSCSKRNTRTSGCRLATPSSD